MPIQIDLDILQIPIYTEGELQQAVDDEKNRCLDIIKELKRSLKQKSKNV